jgi:hypothetical protein
VTLPFVMLYEQILSYEMLINTLRNNWQRHLVKIEKGTRQKKRHSSSLSLSNICRTTPINVFTKLAFFELNLAIELGAVANLTTRLQRTFRACFLGEVASRYPSPLYPSCLPRRSTASAGLHRYLILTIVVACFVSASSPTIHAKMGIIGDGTPESCTEVALKTQIAQGGIITFACGNQPHTITLTDVVHIVSDTVLDGGGSRQGGLITLSGNQQTRVLSTEDRVSFTLQNLTVIQGKELDPADDLGQSGGGLYGGYRSTITVINSIFRDNDGTAGVGETGGGAIVVKAGSRLVVQDSLFERNRGSNGGAINSLLSDLTVLNSTFIENDSTAGANAGKGIGQGGAIYADGASEFTNDTIGGQILIRGSIFERNRGSGHGGGVFTFAYPPDIVKLENDSFISNTVILNAANYAFGGGYSHGNAQWSISNTTFWGNSAVSQGGGFWVDSRGDGLEGTLTNVTFSQNQAIGDEATGTNGLGGAIGGWGNWHCLHCTIAENYAAFLGGGIFSSSNDNILLTNSIIAHNRAANNGNDWNKGQNCAGPDGSLGDGGSNLQYPARTVDPNDPDPDIDCTVGITVAEPLLGQLADNGGDTLTIELLAGSPAIDTADLTACPEIDQRGVKRPQNFKCDIGAFELVNVLSLNQKIMLPIILKEIIGR